MFLLKTIIIKELPKGENQGRMPSNKVLRELFALGLGKNLKGLLFYLTTGNLTD